MIWGTSQSSSFGQLYDTRVCFRAWKEGYPKVLEDFTIKEMAYTRAFSWLEAPTSAFTFNTLLRHYAMLNAKQTLTHGK